MTAHESITDIRDDTRACITFLLAAIVADGPATEDETGLIAVSLITARYLCLHHGEWFAAYLRSFASLREAEPLVTEALDHLVDMFPLRAVAP